MFLIALFIQFTIHAQEAQWQGFKDVEKTGFEFAPLVQAVTYKTISFGMGAKKQSEYKILNTDKQKITKNKTKLDTDYFALQIETCRRQNLKKCPVLTNKSVQATSIIEDGKILHSCRHPYHNWLFVASNANSMDIKDLTPPLLILNNKNEVVYNSAYSPEELKISLINESPRLNVFYGPLELKKRPRFHGYTNVTDYMVMEFSSPIVEPRAIPKAEFAAINFYVSGYPLKTNFYGGVKNGDAPGNVLVMTSGTMIEPQPHRNDYKITNVSSGGMSGGIALNKNGEMLGISCSGDTESSVITNIDPTKVVNIWSYFEGFEID
jgi:hypothetical protein